MERDGAQHRAQHAAFHGWQPSRARRLTFCLLR